MLPEYSDTCGTETTESRHLPSGYYKNDSYTSCYTKHNNMPITFGYSDSRPCATWNYDFNDIAEFDLDFCRTIYTLTIYGIDEHDVYATKDTRRSDNLYVYDDAVFVEHSRLLRNLPLIELLDLESLFPNVHRLTMKQLNINVLKLHDTLCFWYAQDLSVNSFNTPLKLYALTLINCYGTWSKVKFNRSIKNINIRGDYTDQVKVSYKLENIRLDSCKFNKIVNEHYLPNYRSNTFTFFECVCPYEDHVVNHRFYNTPGKYIVDSNGKRQLRSETITSADSILSITKTNRRIDAEPMTNILVSIRNKSFGGGGGSVLVSGHMSKKSKSKRPNITDGSIQAAFALGSNVSRRAMEFITHL
jgi:hypothetical protein